MSQNVTERRKRNSVPKRILFVGILILLYPIFNYFQLSNFYGTGIFHFRDLFSKLTSFQLLLLFMPFISGIGIIKVQNWGLVFFVINSIFIASYNIYGIYLFPIQRNIISLFEILFFVTIVIFILRKDISYGFFRNQNLGFRRAKRKLVSIEVVIQVNGKRNQFETSNISTRGFVVNWLNCPLALNTEVEIELKLNETLFVRAGLVRKTDLIAGFAFRNIDEVIKEKLKKEIIY